MSAQNTDIVDAADAARFAVRSVRPEDVPTVVTMVYELAEHEEALDQCHLTEEQLHEALFGAPDRGPSARPMLFGHVATLDGVVQGYSLWFLSFSIWEGMPGIYMQDLYVRPQVRGYGGGRALLAALAQECVRRGYQRVEWSVLRWNPARNFYHAVGGEHTEQWLPYRLSGPALHRLATHALCDNG